MQPFIQILLSWVGAFVLAWFTANWALKRDRAAWAKEVDQPVFDDCQARIDVIAEWSRAPRQSEYPFVAFMRLERGFRALGADCLLPDLGGIRHDVDKYNSKLCGMEMSDRDRTTRALYRDLMALGISLHNHRRYQLGLRKHPFKAQDIDAGMTGEDR